jgi:hypothetical protein
MGPRLCDHLHDPCGGLHAESQPLETVFGGAAPLAKPVKAMCESGERFHVSAWYRFAPMGATLCARLDDPSGSLHAHFRLRGTTFGRARALPRQVQLHYLWSARPACRCRWGDAMARGPEAWRSSLDDPSGAWRI